MPKEDTMQDSSEFQFIAIDQIHESTTNPRQTFDQSKLEELAESIRQHGLIQPVTVRPNANGFEIVAGARRFRASQLAERFSIPARIVELTDAEAMEWQLVENSQRVDVHPYEEAQGFQRLLDMPGYDVAALVAKSGKSASHIYARLSLLQLIGEVAQAFVEERITASHANLIARLPQERQAEAFEECWRKDWQEKEAHLLPAKNLAAWIETNMYLALADAPFDREDVALSPSAGACVACPRRSAYNTSLFADVQGDQCLDSACYQTKVAAHIDRELAERPELIQIETTWRPAKDQRPGALQKNHYRELDLPDNPDADPPCPHAHSALIVFGREVGKTLTICTEDNCPVHNPAIAASIAKHQAEHPAPVMTAPPETESEEEAEQREADYAERCKEHEVEQQRLEEERVAERKAAFERQQQEFEEATKQREKEHQSRLAVLKRIEENAPSTFNPAQLRIFIELLLNLSPYGLFEDAAEYFTGDTEVHDKTEDEILSEALANCEDDNLMGFLLRLVLSEHVANPLGEQPDWLIKAEAVFVLPSSNAARTIRKKKPTPVKESVKKTVAKKKVVA
jgi:ParB family chromosome partitioning protein